MKTVEVFSHMVKGRPVYKTLNVDCTNKRVIIYDTDGSVYGQAGVVNAKDFDYDSLLALALKRSGATINE